MKIAMEVAQMSRANRLKVGAVVVKNDNIISFSWNGTPRGMDNECEDSDGNTKPEVVHAEQNCLYKLTRTGGVGAEGATMFCTHTPCIECSKGILTSGIEHVIYKTPYRSQDGVEFLKKNGVKVDMYK